MKLLAFLTLAITLSALQISSNPSTEPVPTDACTKALNKQVRNSNGVLVLVEKDGNYNKSCVGSQVTGSSTACVLKATCFTTQYSLKSAKLTLSTDLAKTCCTSSS